MKYLLSLVILAFCLTADAATVWNRFTTNVDGTPINGGVLTNTPIGTTSGNSNLVTAISQPTPNDFFGFGKLVQNTNNPVILRTVGFSDTEVRDQGAWSGRGSNWVIYTASVNGVSASPHRVTLGLASSPDGRTWTDYGQIINTNLTSGFWNSGTIFSPHPYYDPVTDILWVFASGSTNDAGWVNGPINIGLYKVAAGLDWRTPANYVVQNNTNPIITYDTVNDGTNGEYAPSVLVISNTWTMWYSIRTDGGVYKIVAATNSTVNAPTNNWSRAGVVLDQAHGINPEEPSVVMMPNGNLVMFTSPDVNTPQWNSVAFFTTDKSGLSGWTVAAPLQFTNFWSGVLNPTTTPVVGAPSAWQGPDGQWFIAYSVVETGGGGPREIGVARFNFEPQHSTMEGIDFLHANIAVVGTTAVNQDWFRFVGKQGGLTNGLLLGGDLMANTSSSFDPGHGSTRLYHSYLSGPVNISDYANAGASFLTFGDRDQTAVGYLYAGRFGNTMKMGSSVDWALTLGQSSVTNAANPQTNIIYCSSVGLGVAPPVWFTNPVTFISSLTGPMYTNTAAFRFTPANPGNWYTGLGNRVSNTAQRATLEIDIGFVDAATGTPVAKVVIEQGLQITNTWTCSAPGTVVSTITNHFSFRLTTNAVVIITDISRGSGASVTIANSQLTSE